MAVTPISSATPSGPRAVTPKAAEAASGFDTALKGMLASVDGTTSAANEAVSNMINGTGDVHEAMIALHRAEMTLQLTVQIRNKLVAAYQDIMRTPI